MSKPNENGLIGKIKGNEENENHFEDFLGLVGIGSGAKRKVERKKRKKIKNE